MYRKAIKIPDGYDLGKLCVHLETLDLDVNSSHDLEFYGVPIDKIKIYPNARGLYCKLTGKHCAGAVHSKNAVFFKSDHFEDDKLDEEVLSRCGARETKGFS